MTVHVMLDLETWGKKPGHDIRSIGAVVFDPIAGTVNGLPYDKYMFGAGAFYVATENPVGIWRNGSFEQGVVIGKERRKYLSLTRDPETVQWWSEQSKEAQSAFADPLELGNACFAFAKWLDVVTYPSSEMTMKPERRTNLRLWSNGPHFDVAILQAVYDAVGLPEPWHYRAPRDFRTTVIEHAGMSHSEFCNYGDAHNALHDAIAQAMTVCEAYRRLKSC